MAISHLQRVSYSWVVCLFFVQVIMTTGSGVHALPGKDRTNLTIMLIISYGQFGFNSSGGLPAAEMALEDINNKPDLLPGYNLVYDPVRDSQCHRGRSLDTFFQGILSDPVKLAVVGCGCSVATTPVAEISYQWNISQISYSSGSPALSSRTRFRKYYRNSPTSDIVAPTLRSTAVHFNWSRIAVITQEEALFTIADYLFQNELQLFNITVTSRTFKTGDDPIETEDLFVESEDYRVFMINAYSGTARQIICEGFKRNYTYPKYAWITYHWYPQQWWIQNDHNVEVDCTDQELERFLDRVLLLQRYQTLDDENTTTDNGIILGDFEAEYEQRALEGRFDIVDVRFRIYDAIWALALALNRTMTMVDKSDISGTDCEIMNGSLVPLHEFDYSNALMGCLIQWNLQRTNFSGVSGHVRFDDNGTRIQTVTTLFQYRLRGSNLECQRIAYLHRSENYKFRYANGQNEQQVYPDGSPPDGSPLIVTNTYHTGLVITLYLLATIGIGFATGCLLFNFIFRNKKLVKISSPKLNYFIIVGGVLMYASIYFFLLPVTNTTVIKARCIIEHWLFTIGYSFMFGTVLAKMWRVYQIFHNPQLNQKVLQDWQLVIFILITVGIAVFLLLLESTIPQLQSSLTREKDEEYQNGKTPLNVTIEYYVMVCYEGASPNFFWQIFIFVYLAVLQIIGIVLAFQTRRVKLHGLRDSKYIAAIIYISSIVLVVLALVRFCLRTFLNTSNGLIAAGVVILTTIFLTLIFVPKMVLLYKDPNGDSIGSSFPSSTKNISNESSANEGEKTTLLEKQLREKENRIIELTLEVKTLKEKGFQNQFPTGDLQQKMTGHGVQHTHIM